MSQAFTVAALLLILVLAACLRALALAERWSPKGTPSLIIRIGAAIRGGSRYRIFAGSPGTAGYLVKISVLSILLSACLAAPVIGRSFATAQAALHHLPRFELSGGVFHADVPQPFIRRTANFLLIIDTTGGTGPQALAARPAGMLITAHRLYLKKNSVQTTIYRFSQFASLKVDRRTLQHLALTLLRWGTPLLAVFVGAVMVGLAFWRALVLAVLLAVVGRFTRRRRDWQTTWTVAAHAWTLPLLLGPFHELLHIGGLVYWAGAIVYGVSGLVGIDPPPAGTEGGQPSTTLGPPEG